MIKIYAAITLVCLLAMPIKAKETLATEQSSETQYETIVKSIKDNPKQAIKDLKDLIDKNNSAAIEYLILVSIYEPEQINTPEFEEIAQKLHNKITSRYKEIVVEKPFYEKYQDIYQNLVKNDYMKCYKDLSCLIQVGAYTFSKFFSIWDQESEYMLYVPWKIIVPCPVAQKLNLTTIMDVAGGGHGAEALDISNCNQYPEYNFPSEVEDYREYIWNKLELSSSGSIRYVYAAQEIYNNIINHYDPDWDLKDLYQSNEFLQALPLETWAMESYPNYKDFSEIINHEIGFYAAVDKLTMHYINTFNIDKNKAKQYARYVMIPRAAKSDPVNKETLRYKILSGMPVEKIRKWIEDKKAQGKEFEEPEISDQADGILMISIHRPDVLKILLELCPENREKPVCIGLNTDINAGNTFGKTALMYAAQYGFMDSVKILLNAGADINAQTNEGNLKEDEKYCWEDICIANGKRTALIYAVQEGHLSIAKYLIKKGADINIKDSRGMTVYDYLSGKAPLFENFRPNPTAQNTDLSPKETYENKNITSQQAESFTQFLKEHSNVQ